MSRPTVLITGAASGIGAATAREAIRRGYRVALADINATGAADLARTLGPQACGLELDVRDQHSWEAAFDLVESELGPVEVLINNAGIIHTGTARQLSMTEHRNMVDVNLLGPIAGMMTALPRMRAQGRGHIITICSMSSFMPLFGYTTYGATKHGLRAFHHSVAIEERGGPVTFTIVHPPSTRTPMLEQEMADPSSVLAFSEKSVSAERVATVIVNTITKKPLEVLFPTVAGQVQRVAGVFPRLMHFAIPRAVAVGRRRRRGRPPTPPVTGNEIGRR